jgi:hypothetical protein
MASTLTLFDYMRRVQREAGLKQSSAFPATLSTEEARVVDGINAVLRELNNKYYLAFKLVEQDFTSSPLVDRYNLSNSPYSFSCFDVSRMARNGVIRKADGLPLQYIDYTRRDVMRPEATAGGGIPTYYTAIGEELILWPKPSGEVFTVRYYPTYIGTDSTGATNKLTLTLEDDVTMLDDHWQDALAYGAACRAYRADKTDEKYGELKRLWEEARNTLHGMIQGGGEEAVPSFNMLGSASYHDLRDRRFYPFGSGFEL